MPWSKTDPVKERLKFVLEWEKRWDAGEGVTNVSELCREFGVSRETAYVWLRRYRDAGHKLEALEERSHRPHHIPNQIPVEVSDVIVAARKERPTWGPLKLRAYLMSINPGVAFPSVSAIAAIIHRNGLTRLRRRRRQRLVVPNTRPFASATEPNAVCCIDFKGWFRTGDGCRCYPLTLIDAYSRYLLRCEALVDPDTRQVRRVLDSTSACARRQDSSTNEPCRSGARAARSAASVAACVPMAHDHGYRSIAFPILGAGSGRLSASAAEAAMIAELDARQPALAVTIVRFR